MNRTMQTAGGALLDLLAPRRCPFCGVPEQGLLCGNCLKTLPWAEASGLCIAPLLYREPVRTTIHRYKFRGEEWLARPFAKLMAQAALYARVSADCVVYVPSYRLRTIKRGFRHMHLLAQELAKELNLPLYPALRKKRNTKPQTEMKSDAERAANVKGVFAAKRRFAGERILLCDDIYTSGASIRECRDALLKAGAGQVILLTLAQRSGQGEADESQHWI